MKPDATFSIRYKSYTILAGAMLNVKIRTPFYCGGPHEPGAAY